MNLDRRLLGLARAVRLHLVLVVGMGLLAGVATVWQAHLLSRAVAAVFLGGRSPADVQGLLTLLLLVVVARAALVWAREFTATLAAARVKSWLRERLFAHVVALGPAFTRGERTGELANTAVEGIEALDAYFAQYLPNLALAALIPLAVLAFVFPLDLVSGLVFLLTAPLIPVFMILIGKLAALLTRRQWESLSRLSAHFLDVLQGLTTLKTFGRSREQVAVIASISDQFGRTTLGVLRVAFLSALVLEMLATISTAIVAVEVGLRLLYGTIVFEQAFFVLVLAPEFYLPLRTLGASFHAGMAGVTAAQRVFAVLETPVAGAAAGASATGDLAGPPDRPEPRPGPRGRTQETHRLSIFPLAFHDVSFAYEQGRRPALAGVSFQVVQGQKVALVGPSGAGKTTIAYLLLRFLTPAGGEITAGGVPLARLPLEAWRQQVAWVPQQPYLFNAGVADNIRLARPEAPMAEVVRAAELAHADEFIRALPQGYETPLGEQGVRLSGGQAQRLALARAFLKDAPLLLLDEAVANLDPEQAALVQESIDSLLAGRTALLIAHRLSTVYNADQIVVLEGGRVAAVGHHAALLHQNGLYRRLVSAYGGLG